MGICGISVELRAVVAGLVELEGDIAKGGVQGKDEDEGTEVLIAFLEINVDGDENPVLLCFGLIISSMDVCFRLDKAGNDL